MNTRIATEQVLGWCGFLASSLLILAIVLSSIP